MYKNTFYDFVDTNFRYDPVRYYDHPLLWKDEMNVNLLFVANMRPGNMEFIDLREGLGWKIIHEYDENKTTKTKQSLYDIFAPNFDRYDRSFLLR